MFVCQRDFEEWQDKGIAPQIFTSLALLEETCPDCAINHGVAKVILSQRGYIEPYGNNLVYTDRYSKNRIKPY